MCYKYGADAQGTDADLTASFTTGMLANANRGGMGGWGEWVAQGGAWWWSGSALAQACP